MLLKARMVAFTDGNILFRSQFSHGYGAGTFAWSVERNLGQASS